MKDIIYCQQGHEKKCKIFDKCERASKPEIYDTISVFYGCDSKNYDFFLPKIELKFGSNTGAINEIRNNFINNFVY